MEEKTYKAQEIMKWFKQFDNKNILIKGKTIELDIEILQRGCPHLLGLQYINENKDEIKGIRLMNYVINNNLSDQEILKSVKENHPIRFESVKSRIETFRYFMENLENGIIVENTHPNTKINVENFIIQFKSENRKNEVLHLGINRGIYYDEFIFDETEYNFNKRLETYIKEHDNRYYDKTRLYEKIEGIYLVEEEKTRLFSFDEEKDKKYLEEEYQRNCWGNYLNKDKNNNKDYER